jgi:hypothetical protein
MSAGQRWAQESAKAFLSSYLSVHAVPASELGREAQLPLLNKSVGDMLACRSTKDLSARFDVL